MNEQKKVKELTISREASASMKGLLICVIVLGHNQFFDVVFPKGVWNWLYSFHVACFFILPYFYKEHEFSWSRCGIIFKRLFWPYTYMFFLLFILNAVVMKQAHVDLGLFITYLTGDFYRISHYTGFHYLWFLPAMFSMLIIMDIFSTVRLPLKRILMTIGFVCFIIFWIFMYRPPIKAINLTLAQYSVFSFMMGLAMFFLGWITKTIMDRVRVPVLLFFISMLVMLALLVSLYDTRCFDPIWRLSFAICPIMGFTVLYYKKERYNSLILRNFGRLSLPIYLFHQPINYVVGTQVAQISVSGVFQMIISFTVVLVVSFLLAKLVMSIKFAQRVLFPR